MAEFQINTGWSIFDITMDGAGEQAGYSVEYGGKDTLLNISVSNSGCILDMGLIYADRLYQENTALPEPDAVGREISPTGPDEEDAWYRLPMWINLHPRKRQLEMIFCSVKTDRLRADSCYREDRVEIYYRTGADYDEDEDVVTYRDWIVCIKVLDLTDEEYAYFRQYT